MSGSTLDQIAGFFRILELFSYERKFNREKTEKFMFITKLFIMLIDSWCLLHTRAIAAVTKDTVRLNETL